MSRSLEARACSAVAEVLGVSPETVTTESSRDNLPDWDSVAIINLMMAIEAEFDVQMTVDEGADLVSVKSILAVLRERGAT